MQRKRNKNLTPIARELRNNPTKEERKLWYDFLSSYPIRSSRQKVLGRYVADFYCSDAHLVIELDGSQHFTDEGLKKDSERTDFLSEYGLSVIRIPNCDVNDNFDGVCEFIDSVVRDAIGSRCTRPSQKNLIRIIKHKRNRGKRGQKQENVNERDERKIR